MHRRLWGLFGSALIKRSHVVKHSLVRCEYWLRWVSHRGVSVLHLLPVDPNRLTTLLKGKEDGLNYLRIIIQTSIVQGRAMITVRQVCVAIRSRQELQAIQVAVCCCITEGVAIALVKFSDCAITEPLIISSHR